MKGITLISAEIADNRGHHIKFFHSIKEYRRATFMPGCRVLRVKRWNSANGNKWEVIGGRTMGAYHRNKERAREKAIEWQNSDEIRSLDDIHAAQIMFTKLGVQYGLLAEFRENGII